MVAHRQPKCGRPERKAELTADRQETSAAIVNPETCPWSGVGRALRARRFCDSWFVMRRRAISAVGLGRWDSFTRASTTGLRPWGEDQNSQKRFFLAG